MSTAWVPSARRCERFGSVKKVATIQNGAGVDPDEDGLRVLWLCRDSLRPWTEAWPQFRHYD